jgi:predicted phage terminase large subunit-like protein
MSSALADALRQAATSWNQDKKIRWETPGELATTVSPKTVKTPALDLVDQALVKVRDTPDSRLIITMAPQEGKSVRVAGDFPAWWLAQKPDDRIVCASYGSALAARNGRSIRRRITDFDLGIRLAGDNGAVHDWTLQGHSGGVLSVGVGSGLTGRPADLLIIDDPIKDRSEADSEVFRESNWSWWTDTASSRLAPGAPVVIILTRWHHDDLAGRLMKRHGEEGTDDEDTQIQNGETYDVFDPNKPLRPNVWTVLNIKARAEDENDILGRQPGEYMVSARKRTEEQWKARERAAGPNTWASLYQGQPTANTGDLFPKEWSRYASPLHLELPNGTCIVPGASEIIQSWDMTFKDTKTSDFVVGQVWMRSGHDMFLLDMIRKRMGFTEAKQAVLDMSARWPQAIAKYIEDKANGPAIINALDREVPGLIPVEPEGSKYARAAAISPLAHSGNIVLPTPEILPGVVRLLLECEQFPSGAHDDTVDGLSQAANRLLLHPLIDPDKEYTTVEDLLGTGPDDPRAILGGY